MRKWTRMIAVLLAAVMILTSQSVSMAAEVLSETQEELSKEQTQPGAEETSGQTDETSEQTKETPDKAEAESEQTKETPDKAEAESEQTKETSEQPKETSGQTENTSGQTTAEPAQPREVTLTDEETGVRVTGMDNVLPEGAALKADEKKEKEDTDYPAQAKEDIAAKLEQENLSLTDIAFYDISLGGGQPSGKIEVRIPVPGDWDGELDAWYIDEQGNVTNMDGEKNASENYFAFQTDHFSLYALSVSGPREEEENTIEETQPAQQQKAPRIGDDGNAAFTSVEQMAEAYYGENATNPQTAGSVTISSSHTGSTVMAGDELSFTVDNSRNSVRISVDGMMDQELLRSAVLHVKKSDDVLNIVRFNQNYFYGNLFKKMMGNE